MWHPPSKTPVLDMPEWREMTEQTDWRVKQPSQVACVSEDLKCWGAWDTTCWHKAKDITPSITWRREAWKEEVLGDLPWKDESGSSSIRWTLELFQRQRWGNLRDGMKRIIMGVSECIDTILNCTGLKRTFWTFELNPGLVMLDTYFSMWPRVKADSFRRRTKRVSFINNVTNLKEHF